MYWTLQNLKDSGNKQEKLALVHYLVPLLYLFNIPGGYGTNKRHFNGHWGT
jgi:hypothetical protein